LTITTRDAFLEASCTLDQLGPRRRRSDVAMIDDADPAAVDLAGAAAAG